MSQAAIKIFKLNFDGSFDEIAYENIKEVFTIVNILAIYVATKKIMYVWIGGNATQALKNHISNIRVLVKEEFPDFRILRNFTFEMREEPFDFFKNLELTKEELYKLIDYQEQVMLPTLLKIDTLKKSLEKLIDSEEYSNAIKSSEEIIKLAQKINDDALQMEYKRLLSDLTAKGADKAIINEIEEVATGVEKEFSKLIKNEEFLNAHKIVEEFEKVNRKKYDLSLIISARELISKEKNIWKKEQERLVKELTKLEKDFFLAIKNLEIEDAKKIMEEGKSLFKNLINDEIKEKWDQFAENLQKAKQKDDLIKVVDEFIRSSEEMKGNFQFSALKSEINTLLTKVQKQNITNYQKKLDDLKTDIISAEEGYNKKLAEIDNLEKEIKKKQKSNLLGDVLRNCQNIIQIAQSIKKIEVIDKYTIVLEQTEKVINEKKIFEEKQKKLRNELEQLENNLTSSLKTMDVVKLGQILEKSKMLLIELVDEEIKKNWVTLENKYTSARDLIASIENLSEEGLTSLNNRSFKESLGYYEQIINQIQAYNK